MAAYAVAHAPLGFIPDPQEIPYLSKGIISTDADGLIRQTGEMDYHYSNWLHFIPLPALAPGCLVITSCPVVVGSCQTDHGSH